MSVASFPSIFFSSLLTSGYREALEALLYFNPQQGRVREAISATVDLYGFPQVVSDGGLLRVSVGSWSKVQALFALDRDAPGRELSGVIVYVRESIETIAILHVAVAGDYSASGLHAGELLTLRLINKVKEIASRVKGVRTVTLLYQGGRRSQIPVRHPGIATKSFA